MTPLMRRTINALLDQAADRERRGGTFDDLARRLGVKGRGQAHRVVSRLENQGFISRTGPRVAFHWRCFKVFRVVRDGNGNAALERWG